MKNNTLSTAVAVLALSLGAAEVPPAPERESWTFRQELATPAVHHAREAYRLVDEYGLKGRLASVKADLDRHFASAASPSAKRLVMRRGAVEGHESFRVEVAANGDVTLTAEDDDGIRRAAFWFEDRESAGVLAPTVRRQWVRNRISRCFFGPIKRPPYNRDELMDDIDYYPPAYLDRLAHEGVNGLWLTVEWRDLAATSFTTRSPDAPRRLAKLRRTVDRCLDYGIKTWIFCIEPKCCADDDPLYKAHPELFGCTTWRKDQHVMCPLVPATQRYVEESVRDVFTQVPELGGILMISHGERPTTCLSRVDPVTGAYGGECPRCAKVKPWQIHWETASAIMRGIRAAGSDAEYVSWVYQPQVRPERGDWVAETARHLPEGVTLAYNFESGAVKDQLGRFRAGGDYWLSFVGPAQGFRQVAVAAGQAGSPLGAKIQVCNSHEVATVPCVPVPGLLYRKSRSMREMGVSTVLQCWYFGNYPGLMNAAAGLLSGETFADDERAFLLRLAAPQWGRDAALMADLWRKFSDSYANYPLANGMQYYGPFHAGVAWPLLADVELRPLGRTWKPQDPPSGDTIGECLENHTIEEASLLATRMAEGVKVVGRDGRDVLDDLAARWQGDRERLLDIGVMKALACQFESGANIFAFYLDRAKAIYESRVRHNAPAALAALRRMDEAVSREEAVTRRMLPLATADSRLGFHSEAEAHQYHPAKLTWRLGELAQTHARIAEIVAAIEKGGRYPLSPHERAAPTCTVGGDWTTAADGTKFKIAAADNGDLTVELLMPKPRYLQVATIDAAGVSWYRRVAVAPSGTVGLPRLGNYVTPAHEIVRSASRKTDEGLWVSFTIAAAAWGGREDRRPEWIQLVDDMTPLWPAVAHPDANEPRLYLSPMRATIFGRLVWTP